MSLGSSIDSLISYLLICNFRTFVIDGADPSKAIHRIQALSRSVKIESWRDPPEYGEATRFYVEILLVAMNRLASSWSVVYI